MSNEAMKAKQGDTYGGKKSGMKLQIAKDCDCDECRNELKCCGQPLVRVNPQLQNA